MKELVIKHVYNDKGQELTDVVSAGGQSRMFGHLSEREVMTSLMKFRDATKHARFAPVTVK